MKKTLVLLFLVLSVFGTRSPVAQTQSSAPEFVAGEVLIQFRPDATATNRADARSWVGAARRALLRRNGDGELEVARTGRSVEEAVALLRTHPAVRYAEPNWIYRHQATSDDPFYTTGLLWGMYGDTTTPANQFGSQAGEAWAANNIGSASVVVGVIDEGIDLNHPDLAANIWTNPAEAAGVAGIDDDLNGYVDDLHGWDFSQNNNSIYDGAPGDNDTDAHGTHVSGTIGGIGGNTQGVAGVNWNVTIISAKFLGPAGGTLANAVKAIDYITDLKSRHSLNIVATNNSWGGGGFSQALLDAIVRGANANILFVAAAGNGNFFGIGQNNDTTPHFPSNYDTTAGAGYDAVIAVAALTSGGAKAGFSNYGKTTVDLGAPGSGINSTTPNNTYSSFSGTSMATPHVTGALALYASLPANAGASALAIKTAILDSAVATPTASLSNITVTNGRLNIGEFAGPPPAAPSALTAAAVSSSQINLAWTDNSADETEFEIHRCQGAACTDFTSIASVGANVVSFNNTGLEPSTLYRYQVRAVGGGGASAFSNVAEATTLDPPPPPAAPSALTAAAVSSSQIDLAWTDNSADETGFEIHRCQGTGCTPTLIASVGANAVSFSNTGLSPSTLYRYQVRAVGGGGASASSNVAEATTLDPPPPPAAPSGLTAAAVSSSQIDLAWADNAADETGFEIHRCQGAGCTGFAFLASVGANVVSFSNTGLSPSTVYRYQVRAVGDGGASAFSNVAEETTQAAPAPPEAPSSLTATPGPGSGLIDLAWTDNSGDETGFKIERCLGVSCTSFAQIAQTGANVTTYRDTNRNKNRTYRYRVRAFNGVGNSAYSNIASAKAP